MPAASHPSWSLYIIRCGDRSLYTGISNDVAARFETHQSGSSRSAKYLRGRAPLSLVYQTMIGSKSEASRAEYLVKKLSKQRKEQLISGQLKLSDLEIAPNVRKKRSDQAETQ